MVDYLVTDDTLTELADSIRAKTGTSDTMTINEMPSLISSLSNGGEGQSVLYTEQNLTTSQKKQARNNISAGSLCDINYLTYKCDLIQRKKLTYIELAKLLYSNNWYDRGQYYEIRVSHTEYYDIVFNPMPTDLFKLRSECNNNVYKDILINGTTGFYRTIFEDFYNNHPEEISYVIIDRDNGQELMAISGDNIAIEKNFYEELINNSIDSLRLSSLDENLISQNISTLSDDELENIVIAIMVDDLPIQNEELTSQCILLINDQEIGSFEVKIRNNTSQEDFIDFYFSNDLTNMFEYFLITALYYKMNGLIMIQTNSLIYLFNSKSTSFINQDDAMIAFPFAIGNSGVAFQFYFHED